MPVIKPISDLRNYTEVLKEVDKRERVYLTRNGQGAYTIMSMEEADELDRIKALFKLLSDLDKTDKDAREKGWIKAEELERELGLRE